MIQVTMHSNIGFNFAPGTTMVSTNIDSYYPTLAQAYSEGYRLTTFYRIPGAAKQQGFMSTAVNIPFQGIFTKWVYTVVVHSGLLELCKIMMEFHTTSYIIYYNWSHSLWEILLIENANLDKVTLATENSNVQAI